ncbi:hypothetical protein O6H91_07G035600 [Diphasiastrum complanatum]|uniref:Uncharacterized protein n=1 Tax=Diphasiastrum complanatum TaxID=34168 RepID=A0ACC2D427_DIPCM|nr:hypothetical protein O6H91_07G035600 [Diphasiastrum complanatum]
MEQEEEEEDIEEAVCFEGPSLDVRAQNPGKSDLEIKEVYAYGTGLRSFSSIVGLSCLLNLKFLSLHSNRIEHMEGLEALVSLEELNLSSNNISVMRGLSRLSSLMVLNLASNQIKEIAGLGGLFALRKLILSHNQILRLDGLKDVHGPRHSLQYVDMRDNLVALLTELQALSGCIQLVELVFSHGKHSNPVCQTAAYRLSVISALPHLKLLDGQDVRTSQSQAYRKSRVSLFHQQQQEQLKLDECESMDQVENILLDYQPCSYSQHQFPPQLPVTPYVKSVNSVQAHNGEIAHQDNFCPFLPQPTWQDLQCTKSAKLHPHLNTNFQQSGHCYDHEPASARRVPLSGAGLCLQGKTTKLPTPHIDHALKGFHRKKRLQMSPPELSTKKPVFEKDQESRLGLLESKMSDLLKNLKEKTIWSPNLLGKSSAIDKSSSTGCPNLNIGNCTGPNDPSKHTSYNDQTDTMNSQQKNPKKNVVDQSSAKDSYTQTTFAEKQLLENIYGEVSQLQTELADLKVQMLKSNDSQSDVVQTNMEVHSLTEASALMKKDCLSEGFSVSTVSQHQKQDGSKRTSFQPHQGKVTIAKKRDFPTCTNLAFMEENIEAASFIPEKIKFKLFGIKSETSTLKQALDVSNRLHEDTERALRDANVERESLVKSLAALTKALEHERSTLNACKIELAACKLKEVEAQEEVKRLSYMIAADRVEQKKKIEQLKLSHQEDLREKLAYESIDSEMRAKAAAEATMSSLQEELANKEKNLRQALDDCVQNMECMKRVQEEAQKEAAQLRRALKTILQKEQDAEALVIELTNVVREQKTRLHVVQLDLVKASSPQENCQELREELSKLRQRAAQSDGLASELETLQKKLQESAKVEWERAESTFKNRLESLVEENRHLKEGASTCREKLMASEDAVKIKNKMLDSQNETIKELKAEVSHTKDILKDTQTTFSNLEAEWRGRLDDEVHQGRELRRELVAQDVSIAELEEELKLEKAAKLKAESSYSLLQKKIIEKDEMLRYVEEEITRVKVLYETREKAIANERDEAMKKLQSTLLAKDELEARATVQAETKHNEFIAMTKTFEINETSWKSLLKEKDEALMESNRRIVQLEEEAKIKRVEMEKQRALSSSKVPTTFYHMYKSLA